MPRPKKDVLPYLREIMDQRGWRTLPEAAVGLGVAADTVSKYAEGKEGIGRELKTLVKAAEAAGIPPLEFIKGILELSA
jgi:transcriptional regulator with XRE-family HTH domain